MIHFALPWMLGVGALGAAAITALHFLSVRRPPELLLPTARFLDEGRVRAVAPSAQPSDVWLLLLRVAALLLAGVAFAGPQWVPASHRVARLVVADAAMRTDSVGLLQAIGATSSSDVVTRFVWSDSADATGAPTGVRAELGAALPIAVRAATALSAEMLELDSIALYVVAPHGTNASEESWRAWRSVWPGAVHVSDLVTVASAETPMLRFDSVGTDDPLRSAFITRLGALTRQPVSGPSTSTHDIYVSRGDSAVAVPSNAAGSIRIVWRENGVPAGWQPVRDTVSSVAAKGVALVAAWTRTSKPSPDALRGVRPIAWWSDGAVAATERAVGDGCVRDVGIVVPPSGDLLLDENANGLMSALLAPCVGAARNVVAIPEVILADSLDTTKGAAAAASHFRSASVVGVRSTPGWLGPALLLVALVLLTIEWVMRDRRDDDAVADADANPAGARA